MLFERKYYIDKLIRHMHNHQIKVITEVYFVVNQGSQRYYIQSAYMLPDITKEQQKKRPLINIPDSFRKLVIVKMTSFSDVTTMA